VATFFTVALTSVSDFATTFLAAAFLAAGFLAAGFSY